MAVRGDRRVTNVARFGLVANAQNRRAHFFVEAARAAGHEVVLVDWLEVLRDANSLTRLCDCNLVRIDSAGESAAVERELLARGAAHFGRTDTPSLLFGELAHLDIQRAGFMAALETVATVQVPFANTPQDIGRTFDKWQSHELLDAGGVRRPACRLVESEFDSPHELVDRLDLGDRIFLKPRFGSSGSGVCAIRRSGRRLSLTAPIEISNQDGATRLYNSLRITTFHDEADQRIILSHLLSDSMIAEEWLPKAKLHGQGFDLRIVVVGGRAQHLVGRTNRHPMTNLHLGSKRFDEADLAVQIGKDMVAAARRVAEDAAAQLPDSLVLGVDVLLDADLSPYVLEMNCFGDLLPGVTFEGQSTYEAIALAMHARCISRAA